MNLSPGDTLIGRTFARNNNDQKSRRVLLLCSLALYTQHHSLSYAMLSRQQQHHAALSGDIHTLRLYFSGNAIFGDALVCSRVGLLFCLMNQICICIWRWSINAQSLQVAEANVLYNLHVFARLK